jgi:hypothetical protein
VSSCGNTDPRPGSLRRPLSHPELFPGVEFAAGVNGKTTSTNGPLTVLRNGTDGSNGVCKCGTTASPIHLLSAHQ